MAGSSRKNARAAKSITKWATAVQGLSTLTDKAAKAAAVDIKAELLKTFDAERNPYGQKWAVHKAVYSHAILNDTGRLRRSFTVTLQRSASDIRVRNSAPYAGYHQSGTKSMAQRLVVPTMRKGIPNPWLAVLRKALLKQWQVFQKACK